MRGGGCRIYRSSGVLSYPITHELPEASVPWTCECGVVKSGFEIRLHMVKLRNSKEAVCSPVDETSCRRFTVSTTWVCED